jgi:type IV pilus assembly protein PilC
MTLFRYRAQAPDGAPHDGTMEESSAHRVRLKLQERGLTVVQIDEANPDRRLLRPSGQLSWRELEIFLQQLQSVVQHGLPLPAAFKAMAADVRATRMRPVLQRLHQDLEQGMSLDEAVERQGNTFPRVFVILLRAGDAAGNLPGVIQMLTRFSTRQVQVNYALQASLTYPLVVLTGCLGVMYFMLTYLIPIFADIFNDFGGELPAPTRFWINVSALITPYGLNWGLFMAMVAGLSIVVWLVLRRSAIALPWLDAVRLRLPLLGHMYYLMALARFARLLGLLLTARVPVLDSLELAAAGSGSTTLQRAVEAAALRVAGGDRIADALSATAFFPHTFCWLLGTGEERGEVDTALTNLADAAEREAGLRDRTLVVMLGPAMVFVVGLLVLQIVVSLYLPIFTLGDMISGS